MRNYVKIGPLALRISSKHLANWGFPVAIIWGLHFWTRTNSGERVFVYYHPHTSITWLWSLEWRGGRFHISKQRRMPA